MEIEAQRNLLLEAGFQEILPRLDNPRIKLYRLSATEMSGTQIEQVAKAISKFINQKVATILQQIPNCPYICEKEGAFSVASLENLGDIYARSDHHVEAMAIYLMVEDKLQERDKIIATREKAFSSPTGQLLEEAEAITQEFNEKLCKFVKSKFKLGNIFYKFRFNAPLHYYLYKSIEHFYMYIDEINSNLTNEIDEFSNYLAAVKKVSEAYTQLGHPELARSWQIYTEVNSKV